MTIDLEHGFVGHLDELVPDLIRRDDIYGADRLSKAVGSKELGVLAKEKQWEVQFLWWNSETQSNWLDGMLRTALLLDHPEYLEKARSRIEHLLSTQDADGYMGIYAPDLRFNFEGENGELWAQASLFRLLLGWYDGTGDQRAFDAVRRGVDVIRQAYPMGSSHPFAVKNDFAGVCHGLMLTDTMDRLYQLTGEDGYLDYAKWLYLEYSAAKLSADDVSLPNLQKPWYRFRAHGPHTYEHLRALLTAQYAGDDPVLDQAMAAFLKKLEICITPGGGPIGDEMIGGRRADASETGYEYCSLQELLDSYSHLLQKTGDIKWADRAEWLLFNAGQGARHPAEGLNSEIDAAACQGIAYLKTDNSSSMTGPLHPGDFQSMENPQLRYKYSPAHQDVAVCCAPNAGRIMPYYFRAMWMRTTEGLLSALYGASDLRTEVNGVGVRIRQETDYPFSPEISILIETDRAVEFTLSLRKPGWAAGFKLSVAGCVEQDNLIHIRRTWRTGDKVRLTFKTGVKIKRWRDEYIVSYGPLLFCLPLEAEQNPGREYKPGFTDRYYSLKDDLSLSLALPAGAFFALQQQPFDPSQPWDSIRLCGLLNDIDSGQKMPVTLVPMGASILRKVTFKKDGKK